MEPLRVAVCEDRREEREALLAMLADCAEANDPAVFSSGEALLAAYRPGAFDLLLMDIYLDGITGVETVEQVRQMGDAVPVAFLTTSPDHTADGYRLSALMYLKKPVDRGRLEEMLELARLKRDNAPALTVSRGGGTARLPLSRILCLEQQGRQVLISLQGGQTAAVYGKLTDLLPQLEARPFFRSHKSYLVHLAQVQRIDQELRCFVLADGENVPIRRDLMGKARRAWEDFLFARTRGDV